MDLGGEAVIVHVLADLSPFDDRAHVPGRMWCVMVLR
jgi:hypothetical protein